MSYVFFDIDGTLIDRKHIVPESTKEAIELLKKNGHHPIVATGRTKCMLIPQVQALGFDGYICGSGSYIEIEGKQLLNTNISTDEIKRVINIYRENGMYSFAESYDYLYCDEKMSEEDPKDIVNRLFNITETSILRSVYDDTIEAAKVSGLAIKDNASPEKIVEALQDDYICVFHGPHFLESFRKDFSKGKAIRKLIELINIDLNDTYAYGDSFNDFEMLKTVKYGVAMGNSDPKLLKEISLHTSDIHSDGIYLSLKQFGLI